MTRYKPFKAWTFCFLDGLDDCLDIIGRVPRYRPYITVTIDGEQRMFPDRHRVRLLKALAAALGYEVRRKP